MRGRPVHHAAASAGIVIAVVVVAGIVIAVVVVADVVVAVCGMSFS